MKRLAVASIVAGDCEQGGSRHGEQICDLVRCDDRAVAVGAIRELLAHCRRRFARRPSPSPRTAKRSPKAAASAPAAEEQEWNDPPKRRQATVGGRGHGPPAPAARPAAKERRSPANGTGSAPPTRGQLATLTCCASRVAITANSTLCGVPRGAFPPRRADPRAPREARVSSAAAACHVGASPPALAGAAAAASPSARRARAQRPSAARADAGGFNGRPGAHVPAERLQPAAPAPPPLTPLRVRMCRAFRARPAAEI